MDIIKEFTALYTGPLQRDKVALIYPVNSRGTRIMQKRFKEAGVKVLQIRTTSLSYEEMKYLAGELIRLSDDIMDVISPITLAYREIEDEFEDMKLSELIDYAARNPGILRSVITVNTFGNVFSGADDASEFLRGIR